MQEKIRPGYIMTEAEWAEKTGKATSSPLPEKAPRVDETVGLMDPLKAHALDVLDLPSMDAALAELDITEVATNTKEGA